MKLLKTIVVGVLVGFIRAYQLLVSPFTPACCKYHPTCSSFAIEAIQMHGPWRGLLLAIWRLLRCNPWSHGGPDAVPTPYKEDIEVENVAR